MKRDMELVRKILVEVESFENPRGKSGEFKVEGYSADQIAYHVRLLDEAGLLSATNFSGYGPLDYRPDNLTWAGHEFLDAARSDTVWRSVLQKVSSSVGSVSFSVLTTLLNSAATEHVNSA